LKSRVKNFTLSVRMKLEDAVYNDNATEARLLLEEEAQVKRGKSPAVLLRTAVFRGASDELIELLITHGADVNDINKAGDTIMTLAVRQGYCGIVNLLLRHGATLEATDKYGNTAQNEAFIITMILIPVRDKIMDPHMPTLKAADPMLGLVHKAIHSAATES